MRQNPQGPTSGVDTASIVAPRGPSLKFIRVPVVRIIQISILAVVLGASWWGYAGADELGWIPHSRTLTVSYRPDWVVGEFRNCFTRFDGQQPGSLSCNREYDSENQIDHRRFMVRFWGRVDNEPVVWTCRRREDIFVCTLGMSP